MASRATFTAVRRPLFSTLTTTIVKSPPPTAHRRSPLFLHPHPTIFKCAPSAAVRPLFPTRFFSTGDPNDSVLDEVRTEVTRMRRELYDISNELRYFKKEYDDRPRILLPLILLSQLVLIVMTVRGANAQGKPVADAAPADNTADCPSLGENAQGKSPA